MMMNSLPTPNRFALQALAKYVRVHPATGAPLLTTPMCRTISTRSPFPNSRLAFILPTTRVQARAFAAKAAKPKAGSGGGGSAPVPRVNIGVFGLMNSGKSTLINRITRQETSIVDSKAGTTADVKIALMEIHDVGPSKLFDTAGVDEEGVLGEKKFAKALAVLKECDLAIIVIDPMRAAPTAHQQKVEREIFNLAFARKVKTCIVFNRRAGVPDAEIDAAVKRTHAKYSNNGQQNLPFTILDLNADNASDNVIKWITTVVAGSEVGAEPNPVLPMKYLTRDAYIFLNIPMDAETPSGRLLRPQAQIQEQVLRHFGTTIAYRMDLGAARGKDEAAKQAERDRFLQALKPLLTHKGPTLLVTDSQAMDIVHPWTLDGSGKPIVEITTFSIAMIQQQNQLSLFVDGIEAYKKLKGDAKVLISEGCNHNLMTKNCDDISTGQLPRAVRNHAGPNVQVDHAFGREFPELTDQRYQLAIHCGACMLDRQKQQARITDLKEANIPVTNYGLLLSYVQGPDALRRTLSPFGIKF